MWRAQILEHLGVRASPLPPAPAREPDREQAGLGFEAAWSSAPSPPLAGAPKRRTRQGACSLVSWDFIQRNKFEPAGLFAGFEGSVSGVERPTT